MILSRPEQLRPKNGRKLAKLRPKNGRDLAELQHKATKADVSRGLADEYKFEAYLADDAEKFIGCRSYAAKVDVKRSVRVCMSQCRVESSECDRGG